MSRVRRIFEYHPRWRSSSSVELSITPEEFGYSFEEGAREGMRLAMKLILEKAIENAPIKSGALKASGQLEEKDYSFDITFSVENPKDGYNYAGVQEQRFGYLQSALDERRWLLPEYMARSAREFSMSYARNKTLPKKTSVDEINNSNSNITYKDSSKKSNKKSTFGRKALQQLTRGARKKGKKR